MNEQQKNAARTAIRLWVNGDYEKSAQENPLADRHRFTEQAGPDLGNYTVRATQTRQSGGSKPVTTQMNSLEYVTIRRVMDLVREHDNWVANILHDWGQGHTFEEIAKARNKGELKYSKTRAHDDFNQGLSLVAYSLQLHQINLLRLSGLTRSDRW